MRLINELSFSFCLIHWTIVYILWWLLYCSWSLKLWVWFQKVQKFHFCPKPAIAHRTPLHQYSERWSKLCAPPTLPLQQKSTSLLEGTAPHICRFRAPVQQLGKPVKPEYGTSWSFFKKQSTVKVSTVEQAAVMSDKLTRFVLVLDSEENSWLIAVALRLSIATRRVTPTHSARSFRP